MKVLNLYIFSISWGILKASMTLDLLFRKVTGCSMEDVFVGRDKIMNWELTHQKFPI